MSSPSGILLVALLAAGGTAFAQEAPPPAGEEGACQEASPPEVARDLARLDALLQSHAAEAHTARLAVGSVFIATGLAAVPLGIVAETSWQQDYGLGLWVSGALLIGFGTAALFLESPLEALDRDFRASATTLSPTARLAFGTRALASVAASARTARVVGAIIDFAAAGLLAGIGVGQLVSASNNVGTDRTNLQVGAASSLTLGALVLGAGVVQLVLPSPAETAYATYQSGVGPQTRGVHVSGGVLPVHGGAVLGLGGTF
jgi:hypothetical protein